MVPTVATGNATLVEETTATLHGTITDDGGEACQYSFEWGLVSGGPYTDNISWTGSVTSGQQFSTVISSLDPGEVYYFRARAMNNAGIGDGSEKSLLTRPYEPTGFTATTASSSQIDLSWTKGAGAERTMVRRQEGSYPTSTSEGEQVYLGTGTNTSDTGLMPNTTYFYSAWSDIQGSQQQSDSYAMTNATTTSGSPTVTGGFVLPVNKTILLAPWLFMALVLSLIATRTILSHRKRRSSS